MDPIKPFKGRGALSNPEGRFETIRKQVEDDGWHTPLDEGEELPALETLLRPDPTRTLITRNQSPDIPFSQSINPYKGCEHGCIYCLAGDTPILMANGTTRPLVELHVGDEIYGTIRRGWYRRYTKTRVLAHWRVEKPAYRVQLEDGTKLVCGGDHRFLTERGWKFVRSGDGKQRPYLTANNKLMGTGKFVAAPDKNRDYQAGYLCGLIRGDGLLADYQYAREGRSHGNQYQFRLALIDREALDRAHSYLRQRGVSTRRFQFQKSTARRKAMWAIGSNARGKVEQIRSIIEWPKQLGRAWQKGFLAGMFDAEGSYSQGILRISNTDARIIACMQECLHELEFRYTTEFISHDKRKNISVVRLVGGLQEHLRFFHSTSPAITRKRNIAGTAVKSGAKLRVTAVEPLGVSLPLYDITTGTGDFIANGVVSHNCYARPSHAYLNLSPGLDFETKIFYKDKAAELLDQELRKPGYRPETITLGANTDPYQPAERKLKVTRGILEVLQRFRHPVGLITKSALVTRDLDILADMARQNLAVVMVTITTLDNALKRALEPRAASPASRLKAVETLAKAGVPVGVMTAPIIPTINDSEMERILEQAAAAGACGAGYVLLRLPYELKDLFKEWLTAHYPLRAEHVMSLIRQSRGGKDYDSEFGTRMRGTGEFAELIASRFALACKRHNLSFSRRMRLTTEHFRVPSEDGQLNLWGE